LDWEGVRNQPVKTGFREIVFFVGDKEEAKRFFDELGHTSFTKFFVSRGLGNGCFWGECKRFWGSMYSLEGVGQMFRHLGGALKRFFDVLMALFLMVSGPVTVPILILAKMYANWRLALEMAGYSED
jgi:hypothetical protein